MDTETTQSSASRFAQFVRQPPYSCTCMNRCAKRVIARDFAHAHELVSCVRPSSRAGGCGALPSTPRFFLPYRPRELSARFVVLSRRRAASARLQSGETNSGFLRGSEAKSTLSLNEQPAASCHGRVRWCACVTCGYARADRRLWGLREGSEPFEKSSFTRS